MTGSVIQKEKGSEKVIYFDISCFVRELCYQVFLCFLCAPQNNYYIGYFQN